MVRNPFSGTLDITTIPSDVQDEFLDLKHDSAAKDLYEEKSLSVFWCSMHQSYPTVSEIALRLLCLYCLICRLLRRVNHLFLFSIALFCSLSFPLNIWKNRRGERPEE